MNNDSKTVKPALVITLFLTVLVSVIYSQVSGFDFLEWDDHQYVVNVPQYIHQGVTLQGIQWAFTTCREGTYQPMVWLSYMLDNHLHGLHPGFHHLANALLHFLNAVLVFHLFRLMTGSVWASGFAAALFAVHPLHVESVAWVAQRKDVLSMLFGLLSCISYFHYAKGSAAKHYLLATIFLAAGLLAKPTMVTMPFVFLLLDWWPLNRMSAHQECKNPRTEPTKPGFLLWEKIPFFLISTASSATTVFVQKTSGALGSTELFSMTDRIENAVVSYGHYLVHMVWPFQLSPIYPLTSSIPPWKVFAAAALLIGLSFLFLVQRRHMRWFAVGWLWYLVTLAPMIGILQFGSHSMADRFMYLPSIGIYLIISTTAFPVQHSRSVWPKFRLVLPCLFLVLLVMISWMQTRYWRDTKTLFSRALVLNSDNWTAHLQLGDAAARDRNTLKALQHYRQTARICPHCDLAHYKMGKMLERQGAFEKAESCYREAMRLSPENENFAIAMGSLFSKQKKFEAAASFYTKALAINPLSAAALFNRGADFHLQGKIDHAIADYQAALNIRSLDARLHNNLGLAFIKKGQFKKAMHHFQKAVEIEPDFKKAAMHLRLSRTLLQDIENSEADSGEAPRIDPDALDKRK